MNPNFKADGRFKLLRDWMVKKPFRTSQMWRDLMRLTTWNYTIHDKNAAAWFFAPPVKTISLCSSESVKTDEDEGGEGEVRYVSQHHVTAERDRKSQHQISNVHSWRALMPYFTLCNLSVLTNWHKMWLAYLQAADEARVAGKYSCSVFILCLLFLPGYL